MDQRDALKVNLNDIGFASTFQVNAKCKRNTSLQFGNRQLKKVELLIELGAICNMLH